VRHVLVAPSTQTEDRRSAVVPGIVFDVTVRLGWPILARALVFEPSLLLLDEPTNDLDVETLSALEAALEDFPGCAVVISHDRFFLDRIATHILAFEGDSHVEWFEGAFSDYLEDKKRRLGTDALVPTRVKFQKFAR
jgi:ABC-type methionine transport system ATPase subunit